jgi:hypothetical protein
MTFCRNSQLHFFFLVNRDISFISTRRKKTIPINIQYTNIVGKYNIYLSELQKQVEKRAFDDVCLFRSKCKLICYLPTMYRYCACPVMLQSPKQLHYCLKIAKTSVCLIILNGVLYEVHVYTVTVYFCCSTRIRYQKSLIRSMTK